VTRILKILTMIEAVVSKEKIMFDLVSMGLEV